MEKFEILKAILKDDRSIRRFKEDKDIERSVLEKLIDLTRYCASGRNLQPLKYRMVTDENERKLLFPHLAWAGYLKSWEGPAEGEKPTAYLIQCLDTRITENCLCDDGLQLQVITAGAAALGIGGCIIKSFNVQKIHEMLNLPDWAKCLYVLALGYPAEKVVIENYSDDIKYYRSADGVHHVPKRTLPDLLI